MSISCTENVLHRIAEFMGIIPFCSGAPQYRQVYTESLHFCLSRSPGTSALYLQITPWRHCAHAFFFSVFKRNVQKLS